MRMGKFKEALADFNESINNGPNDSRDAYEARAELYEKTGQKELANKDRATAQKIRARPAVMPL